jgi:hypothetical protein
MAIILFVLLDLQLLAIILFVLLDLQLLAIIHNLLHTNYNTTDVVQES